MDAGVDAASFQHCSDPAAEILNQPDGGVVFNNAMTSADAGHIDRMQKVLGALASATQRFRCCFEPWAQQRTQQQGRLLLLVTLAPDGAVRSAAVDAQRSTIHDDLTAACVSAVASGLAFAPSPTGKETHVEYPFQVARQGDETPP